ncbi:hypothetical protein BpHYR1_011529 [Brachionus plicatilis]|uniref:Uncharacterized protein n=1 Tax=Brachionus plicatilis TaxID=10195 RepID=A0A3M7QZ78_BRAPC|nr:hypothetical protein BpHYR1_011529 [Brachionus plicatilis]
MNFFLFQVTIVMAIESQIQKLIDDVNFFEYKRPAYIQRNTYFELIFLNFTTTIFFKRLA